MEGRNFTPISAKELKLCVGERVYSKIMKRLAGRYIYINKSLARFENPYFKMNTDERNRLLWQDYQNGVKAKELSAKYCLQLGYTYNLIQRLKRGYGGVFDV
jgi:Mor family transcriptional regulator